MIKQMKDFWVMHKILNLKVKIEIKKGQNWNQIGQNQQL